MRVPLIPVHLLFLLGSLGLAACGKVSSSGTSSSRSTDPFPVGATVRAQGNLQAFGGATVSGSASALQGQDGTAILRLESFSSSGSISRWKVVLLANGVDAFSAALKAPHGNQNYQTGLPAAQTWSAIEIRDTAQVSPNDVIARALLVPTTSAVGNGPFLALADASTEE